MPPRHQLLAVLVACTWGLNFLAIDASLGHFPPFFLVALRFAVIAVPTVLLVPRPQVPVRWLVGYGLGFGTLQFLFLYWGMEAGMPPGTASLVLQASAPFTLVLGAALLGERVGPRGVLGVVLAGAGLAVVGWHRAEAAGLLPFLLVLAGALGWAIGNLCSRLARAPQPLHLTLWMSVVPPVPMLVLALAVEGPQPIATSLTTLASPSGVLALAGLAYTVLVGTVVGSGLWTWLMARHPASQVAPFSMLVPVVGMSGAWVVLGEQAAPLELAGATLVVGGVLLATLRRGVRAAPVPVPMSGPMSGPVPAGALGSGRD
ncbi:EamA family transporter [Nocardioides aurantiacus]|uniref:O-acetylserine/cysteine efflux transporter n=1 Tax=Nocardioides aurantiacus TaxID=86796 RepID=A0A3N2CUY2_9ACTN|nr:EamA family transporter [Nocardioides aurantiacus]ROR91362.1 O-acetylserine/cysteine efflux transporter [Nocardioides aurantiacus]